MRKKKLYPINQSPLYKLGSHSKLASILGLKLQTIHTLASRGDNNYYFSILKSKSGSRNLEVPKQQLRRVHARLQLLFARIEKPNYLNSGVKGRSHIRNAQAHCNNGALASLDLKSFYKATSYDNVLTCFRKHFLCSKDLAKTLADLSCVKGHVPTGSPLSQNLAFLSNLGAFNHINHYAKSRGLEFSVYVDDLTFSGQIIPKGFLGYISGYLKSAKGYKSHKFRTYNTATPKKVTGVIINNSVLRVKNSQRKEICYQLKLKDELKGLIGGKHTQNDENIIKIYQRLIGHLFSAGQIERKYYDLGKAMITERTLLKVGAEN